MAAPVVCLAENKAEFVRDCWAALDRKDTDPIVIAGLPPFSYHGDVPTPLESVLVTSLVYARLSQYMLYDREVDDEADALAAVVFRGARDLADVTYALWQQFEQRVREVHASP